MFQIIQNDVETPYEVKVAIATLNSYGYNIDARPTGKAVFTAEDIDEELLYFFNEVAKLRFNNGDFRRGVEVEYLDLSMLDNVAEAIQGTRNDRDTRHRIALRYFGETTSHELHVNLGGFRNVFKHLDRNGKYSVKLS